MATLLSIVFGAVCGIAAAAPLFVQLKSGKADLGRGFGAVIFAFVAIQAAMFAMYALAPAGLVPFGVTATFVFLGMTISGALRH